MTRREPVDRHRETTPHRAATTPTLELFWGGWTRALVVLVLAFQLGEAVFDALRGELVSTALPRLLIVSGVAYAAWHLRRRPLLRVPAPGSGDAADASAEALAATPLRILLSAPDRATLREAARGAEAATMPASPER